MKHSLIATIFTLVLFLVIFSIVGAICPPLAFALLFIAPIVMMGSHSIRHPRPESEVVIGVKKEKKEGSAWEGFMGEIRKQRRARREEERKNPKPKWPNPVIILADVRREKRRIKRQEERSRRKEVGLNGN